LSAAILKETVGAVEVLGILLILSGVWVVHVQTSKPSHP
jgi:drug/metabolite transporter (DMT)-like permease